MCGASNGLINYLIVMIKNCVLRLSLIFNLLTKAHINTRERGWSNKERKKLRLLMMPKSSPVRCTILAFVAVAYKREQHKNTLPKAPVWSRPNTLQRLSQKSFYNSRVLERSQSRAYLFMRRMLGLFIVVRSGLLSL